jgi:DNA (cytosine-5)-methyltransferase 1
MELRIKNDQRSPRVAEFFSGIGLVRLGLEAEGLKVVFANDIDSTKRRVYEANFGARNFLLSDVRSLTGDDVPSVEMAVASFPCTDLSLAGPRAGLDGQSSGLVHEFLRILAEMGKRKPEVVLLENVLGFASSNAGDDLRITIERLNTIGYVCDIAVLNAANFVPQSRPRIFIIAWLSNPVGPQLLFESDLRPSWVLRFREKNHYLGLKALKFPPLPHCSETLSDVVDKLDSDDRSWWNVERLGKFAGSLSEIQTTRLRNLEESPDIRWATAYRRTRHGKAVWEIRKDDISGCLRTGKGGSSRQALVEAGKGESRVRWMTAREYCRLQGAPNIDLADLTENQGRFALGDAVCVPAISWLARYALLPLLSIRFIPTGSVS